jgi:hypothetical protein
VQRIDLKVNVSCCDGCRRKVMKAMSLKGHHPSSSLSTGPGLQAWCSALLCFALSLSETSLVLTYVRVRASMGVQACCGRRSSRRTTG